MSRIRIAFLAIVVTGFASAFNAVSSSGQQLARLTLTYVYEVRGGGETLPPTMDPKIATDAGSIRAEIARLEQVDLDSVLLIGTEFGVHSSPRTVRDSQGELQYRARFCRYDPVSGKPEVDFDRMLTAEGAAVLVARGSRRPEDKGKKAYVIVLRDFLAPTTLDIVKLQEDLRKNDAAPEIDPSDRPALFLPSRWCPDPEGEKTADQGSDSDFGETDPQHFHEARARWGVTLGEGPDGMTTVMGVLPKTPAARAGLEEGDAIRAVDGRGIAGQSVSQVASLMRNSLSDAFILSVIRNGRPLDIRLTESTGTISSTH